MAIDTARDEDVLELHAAADLRHHRTSEKSFLSGETKTHGGGISVRTDEFTLCLPKQKGKQRRRKKEAEWTDESTDNQSKVECSTSDQDEPSALLCRKTHKPVP
uniref:Uncharacterized protein n=1 Tax=Steinernema glaseri TaxID=37863 RepID=A0A1I7ZWT8_9BILA